MGPALLNVPRADVDDLEPDGLGRVNGEVEVLCDVELVARVEIDDTLVDGFGLGQVDQPTEENAIGHDGEELGDLADGQQVWGGRRCRGAKAVSAGLQTGGSQVRMGFTHRRGAGRPPASC